MNDYNENLHTLLQRMAEGEVFFFGEMLLDSWFSVLASRDWIQPDYKARCFIVSGPGQLILDDWDINHPELLLTRISGQQQ